VTRLLKAVLLRRTNWFLALNTMIPGFESGVLGAKAGEEAYNLCDFPR